MPSHPSLPRQPAGARSSAGFTLIEALLAVTMLGLAAVAATALFGGGMTILEGQAKAIERESLLRSWMEYVLSAPFDAVNAGSAAVTLGGVAQTVTWTTAAVDLDGDAVPEATAKEVVVSLDGSSLRAIIVRHDGRLRKI